MNYRTWTTLDFGLKPHIERKLDYRPYNVVVEKITVVSNKVVAKAEKSPVVSLELGLPRHGTHYDEFIFLTTFEWAE